MYFNASTCVSVFLSDKAPWWNWGSHFIMLTLARLSRFIISSASSFFWGWWTTAGGVLELGQTNDQDCWRQGFLLCSSGGTGQKEPRITWIQRNDPPLFRSEPMILESETGNRIGNSAIFWHRALPWKEENIEYRAQCVQIAKKVQPFSSFKMTRQTQLLYQNDDGDLPQDPNIYHGYIFDQKNAVFGAPTKLAKSSFFSGAPKLLWFKTLNFLGFIPIDVGFRMLKSLEFLM